MLHVARRRPGHIQVGRDERVARPEEKRVVHEGDFSHMEARGIAHDKERAIRNLRDPKKARVTNRRVEVVHLRTRTGFEEINSYQDERAVVVRAINGHVLALVDTDVAAKVVSIAAVVRGGATEIALGDESPEIGNPIRLDV